MPWSVVSQTATLQGGNDLLIEWVRRSRVASDPWGVTAAPLAEDTEAYDIEIYSAPAGALLRTFSAVVTPSVTYTAAEQVTDGFTPPLATLTVKIYQISAQVGRGFSRETTLTVV